MLVTEVSQPSGSNGRKAVQVQVLLPAPKIDKSRMLLVDFISLPTRNRQVSLRLGHAPAILQFIVCIIPLEINCEDITHIMPHSAQ